MKRKFRKVRYGMQLGNLQKHHFINAVPVLVMDCGSAVPEETVLPATVIQPMIVFSFEGISWFPSFMWQRLLGSGRMLAGVIERGLEARARSAILFAVAGARCV